MHRLLALILVALCFLAAAGCEEAAPATCAPMVTSDAAVQLARKAALTDLPKDVSVGQVSATVVLDQAADRPTWGIDVVVTGIRAITGGEEVARLRWNIDVNKCTGATAIRMFEQ
jgi:hypothetical protein